MRATSREKLIFPDILGAGRFARIGIPFPGFARIGPFPHVMGLFVGVVETVCGLLIIIGLFTRLAPIPLIIIMIVALISTKLLILLGHNIWIFHLASDIKRTGFWSMMHEARAGWGMSPPPRTGGPPGHQHPQHVVGALARLASTRNQRSKLLGNCSDSGCSQIRIVHDSSIFDVGY